MCGIFAFINTSKKQLLDYEKLEILSNNIKHRGPDSTTHKRIKNNVFFSFHRLAINGLNTESDQPMYLNGVHLICNGEIYNYKKLIIEYNLQDEYKSESDCEIILHLYLKFGIDKTCRLLDGEFAFILYDETIDNTFIARDQLGIRSLYWSNYEDGFTICSELKGLDYTNKYNYITQFPTGTYCDLKSLKFTNFYSFVSDNIDKKSSEEDIIKNIRDLFTKAVEKRLMSDRKLACLLSGGLDSTTVTAIVASKYEPYSLSTYSIGLKDSVDLQYAKLASDYFKTNHTSIELTTQEFLGAIEKTIKQIESYDTTSVRASVGNYLVSLYIKENSDDTVIFCGDVSDEIFGSYKGFYYAPDDESFYEENVKMLDNIQYFDVLRSDKSIAGAGLEARVPFSDGDFLKYCMSIDPSKKRFNKEYIEKYLFRRAFEHLLPYELAWRVKTAFSDGVSNSKRPWYKIIKEYMDTKYTDDEYQKLREKYSHNKPYDKESLYYREVYESYYPNTSHTIPYFWKQPFTTISDPSAWCVEKPNE
jgi:asparagine synthase (glutamine-hydrolysing)